MLAILNLFRGARLVALREGMGQLAEVGASTLDVKLGSEVVAARQTADGATVIWRDAGGEQTEDVAGCVVALPAQHAARVREDLDPWRRNSLGAVRQGRLITPNTALDRAPPGSGRATPWSRDPGALSSVASGATISRRPAAPRMARACSPSPSRTRGASATATMTTRPFLARLAVETIEPLFPKTADDARYVQITRWMQQYAPVGHYRELAAFRARSSSEDRTVQLAGEYLASTDLNAAVASGQRAARDLVEVLTSA